MIGGLGCIWDIMRFMGTRESEADYYIEWILKLGHIQ